MGHGRKIGENDWQPTFGSKPIENNEVYGVLEVKEKLEETKCCIFVLRVYPPPVLGIFIV